MDSVVRAYISPRTQGAAPSPLTEAKPDLHV